MCDDGTVDRARVAPGPGQRVASSTIQLNVVVRDLMGAPIAGAKVDISFEGERLRGSGTESTNENGLIATEVPGGRQIEVTARKVARTDQSFDGRLAYPNATVTITTAATGPDWVTVFMAPTYRLLRKHPWQNAAIRARHYIDVRGSATDPGSSGQGNNEYAKTRNGRLQEAIEYLADRLPESGPNAPASPQLDDDQRAAALRSLDEREERNRQAQTEAEATRGRHRRRRALAQVQRERESIQAARQGIQSHARHQTLGAMNHRQLLEYLDREIFANDPSRQLVPDWARYMIIHYTGFYYRSAHFSICPPSRLLMGVRQHEIENIEVADRASGADIAPLIEEFRALLRNQPDVADTIGGQLAGRPRRRRRRRGRRGSAPEEAPTETEHQRQLRLKLDSAEPGRRRGADAMREILVAMAQVGRSQLNEGRGLGLLAYRHVDGAGGYRIEGEEWTNVVHVSRFRNDLADSAMVDGWWGRSDDNRGPRGARIPARPSWMTVWRTEQARRHYVSVLSCVCNEVAEMAAQARGLDIGGQGLWGDARQAQDLAARGDADEGEGEGSASEEPPAVSGATETHPSQTHRLWRVTSLSQLAPGDIVFQMGWRRLVVTDDADSVLTNLDMVYLDDRGQRIPLNLGPGAGESGLVGKESLHRQVSDGQRSEYERVRERGPELHRRQEAREDLDRREQRQLASYNRLAPYMSQPELHRGALHGNRYALTRSNARHHHTMIVRKSDGDGGFADRYDEVLAFTHMFTIVYVDPPGRRQKAVTFETHAPCGMTLRPLQGQRDPARNYGLNAWRYVVARPAASTPPNLRQYLDMRRMLRTLED